MGILTLLMTFLTTIILGFGALYGMARGRNRSILRLLLLIVSVILAFALRNTILDLVMGIKVGDKTIQETLTALISQEGSVIPESIYNLFFALMEMIVGLIAYFVLFFSLRSLTWMIAYTILKIFVKREAVKDKGLGAFFGLIQGLVVAFAVIGPLNGFFITIDKVSQVKINNQPIFSMSAALDVEGYKESSIGKTYISVGSWYFEKITSVEMSGKKININDACDMVTTVVGVVGSVTDLTESMEVLTKEETTPQEKVNAVKDIGQKLIETGDKIDSMGDASKDIINEVIADIKQMIPSDNEEASAEVDKIFEDLKIEDLNLQSVGKGLTGLATYIEKTELDKDTGTEGGDSTGGELGGDVGEMLEEVTQEEVNDIVEGFAGSPVILEYLTNIKEEDVPSINIQDEHKEMFETAINGLEEGTVTEEQKQTLKNLLGLV